MLASSDCFCQVTVACLPADWTQGDETGDETGDDGGRVGINEYGQYYVMDCESKERW